ncbi:MAG TPA: pyruvate dehydrogenase complex dihydrolipoamide acetyltransferase [Saprospiraceae bacterium]|nr:pyruvate dehydrogenase complex dihydrolipoamide acetyltransferase [Saprospiraceae bacterium]
MAEVIRMPRLSDTMEEGNIVGWLKNVGDKVQPGDVLAEVETDKATMDLESFQEGTLLYIGVKEGPVAVDGIIAIIGAEGEDYQSLLQDSGTSEKENNNAKKESNSSDSGQPSKQLETQEKGVKKADQQKDSAPLTHSASSDHEARVKASPLAKSMAKEAGIEIDTLQGSGEGGRIIKRDIEDYIKNPPQKTVAALSTSYYTNSGIEYGEKPVSQMRKTIARRLSESKFSAPHFYLTIEINMDEAVRARKMVNEVSEQRISFNDIIIKACAVALRKHPAVNSSWLGDKIRTHEEINIGVAVAVEEGLLVPVVRNADAKPLSWINQEVRELAGKAKERKLKPEEMQGNTFTISNLGMFDIDEFTAIINPPDACILAVGSIIQKPIIKNGEIAIGNMMKVTLSCDHRVVDGAKGAQFLQSVKAMLENPLMIIV